MSAGTAFGARRKRGRGRRGMASAEGIAPAGEETQPIVDVATEGEAGNEGGGRGARFNPMISQVMSRRRRRKGGPAGRGQHRRGLSALRRR